MVSIKSVHLKLYFVLRCLTASEFGSKGKHINDGSNFLKSGSQGEDNRENTLYHNNVEG